MRVGEQTFMAQVPPRVLLDASVTRSLTPTCDQVPAGVAPEEAAARVCRVADEEDVARCRSDMAEYIRRSRDLTVRTQAPENHDGATPRCSSFRCWAFTIS